MGRADDALPVMIWTDALGGVTLGFHKNSLFRMSWGKGDFTVWSAGPMPESAASGRVIEKSPPGRRTFVRASNTHGQ
jgi:hypothetical protein